MINKIYAMDFSFYNTQGVYNFDAQCEMVKEIGYDGIHRSIWDGTRWQTADVLATVKKKHGLDATGIYIVLDLDYSIDHPQNSGILTLLDNIEGCTQIDLSIRSAGEDISPSSTQGDKPVCDWLKLALKICERRGIEILLYTHIKFWLEKHSDAVRLCKKINHPHLGIVFTSFHWYALEGGSPVHVLNEIYPYLRKVHLSGSRQSPLGFAGVASRTFRCWRIR